MKDKGMTLEDRQARAAAVLENVTGTPGGTVVTGPAVELYRLSAMIGALKLEVKGIKNSRFNIYEQVKTEFGFKGSREAVLALLYRYRFLNYPSRPLDALCPECGAQALVVVEPTDGVDMTDGTAVICHPMLKGCNTGFSRE